MSAADVRTACQDHRVVFCDYFAAPDDEAAVAVLEGSGGPQAAGFDTVPLQGLDPVVVMAQLEAILTGCTYDEAGRRPRSGELLSSPDAESGLTLSVSDSLCGALAFAERSGLEQAAEPWAAIEELRDQVDPAAALNALMLLADLARRGCERGYRLYCWWAL